MGPEKHLDPKLALRLRLRKELVWLLAEAKATRQRIIEQAIRKELIASRKLRESHFPLFLPERTQ